MNILLMMVPVALLLGGFFVSVFIWSVRNGQFDDSITPAHRMLNDEQENLK
jgi:cbb3-type cytochrome oxidase maturation protein